MFRNKRFYLAAAIAVSIIGFAALVVYQYTRRGGDSISITVDSVAGAQVHSVRYVGVRDGKLAWEVKTDKAVLSKAQDIANFSNVEAVFYADNSRRYVMKAAGGNLNESRGYMEVFGGVVVVGDDSEKLAAEKIVYSVKSREITSPSSVVMTARGLSITGSGLTFDVKTDRVTLMKDVRAVISSSSGALIK